MRSSIHGPAMTSVANTASSLGMNDSVASLICVAAWKMLTIRPMMSATSSSGAPSSSEISMARWPMVMTDSGVISAYLKVEALRQRADQQLPAVGQHEQHQLEGQCDGSGRHHHHAHRHQHAGHHQVDDEERNEDG